VDEVLISVDPHKASSTLAVLDPVTRTVIDGALFANTKESYREHNGRTDRHLRVRSGN
jgi:hypothetical protein